MNELQKEVAEIINNDLPQRHTFFQLNFFVLGKEPTHQGKLKRCVEELRAKSKEVEGMALEIDELKDKNELLYLDMDAKFSSPKEREIRCRMADRRIQSNNRSIDDLTSRMKYVEEEMVFFVEAFRRLSQVSPMKQWDDLEVQTEYWDAKLLEDLNHRVLLRLPVDAEMVKTALALPAEAKVRKQIAAILKQSSEKLLNG